MGLIDEAMELFETELDEAENIQLERFRQMIDDGLIRPPKKPQEGKASEHIWRSLVTTFSPVMRLIHETMRMDLEDTKALADELFEARKTEFNDAISDYVSQLGCGGTGDLKTSSTELKFFREDSDRDAQNITTTYNLNLAEIIQNIRLASPRANRHIYSSRLRKWEADRKLWKSTQIALWTTMTARDQALKSFAFHNNLRPKVKLMPKLAKEPICQGWVNRGAVAFEIAVNNKSPYHPNCVHFWKPTFEKIEDCTNLWKG